MHPLPHSTALLTPSLPLVWQLNAVRVEELDAPADQLLAVVEHALGHASHRKLVVHDEKAGARWRRCWRTRVGTSTGCW